jgi:general secretion pathway protein N
MLHLLGAVVLAAGSPAPVAKADGSGRPGSAEFALASPEIGSRASSAEDGAPDGGEPSPPISEFPKGNPLWAIPVSRLSATRDRPLFSPSRRPPPPTISAAPEPPPAPVKPVVPESPSFKLVGTIIGEDNRIGIFMSETSQTTIRIREGEGDSGWTLRSIDPHSAVFEGYGRMVTLVFHEAEQSGDPAGAAPGISGISGIARKRKAGNGL